MLISVCVILYQGLLRCTLEAIMQLVLLLYVLHSGVSMVVFPLTN